MPVVSTLNCSVEISEDKGIHQTVPEDITYLHSGNCSTFRLSFLTMTPTLVAASCRRFLKVLVVGTFPFLRHLPLLVRVMDLSTAESISADNVRHLQPAGYTTHTTVWERREENCESTSVPFIQIPSLCVLFPACCVRKVTMWWPAGHLDTQRGMERVSS